MYCKLQNHNKIRGILTTKTGSSCCWRCLIWLMWFYCYVNKCKIKNNTSILETLILYEVVFQRNLLNKVHVISKNSDNPTY